jgi:hypothetical protein
MPLRPFQREVARILAANRQPDSHFAGGAVINRGEASLRYSQDLDIFHDVAASVAASAEADAKALIDAGCAVEWTLRGAGLFQAVASRGDDRVRLDWTTDSAFRFFPAQPDEEFGYALHAADLATNKVLALAGRTEIRDFLDTLTIDRDYLSLGAVVWAACGKDPGFTPGLLLDQANRHARFQESDLQTESLTRPVDLRELKNHWLVARDLAHSLIGRLPEHELGCLYLGPDGRPTTPDPASPEFAGLRRHFGSVRGAWPKLT